MHEFNLDEVSIRELNQALHDRNGSDEHTAWSVTNTKGKHAVAVGIDAPLEVTIDGARGILLRRYEQAGVGDGPR